MPVGITREHVTEYYNATLSREPARIARCLHDDVQWSLSGPVDLLPFCGHRSGKAAAIDAIVRAVPSVIRLTKIDLEELLIDGDRASVLIRLGAIHANSGRVVSYRTAQFLRFQDGKLIELRALIDTFDAAEQVLGHPINALVDTPPPFARTGNRITL